MKSEFILECKQPIIYLVAEAYWNQWFSNYDSLVGYEIALVDHDQHFNE